MRAPLALLLTIAAAFIIAAAPAFAETAASHRDAARELLTLMDAKHTMMASSEAMADAMVQSNPTMRPYRDVLLEWTARVMVWERFEGKLVDIYVDAYSEKELRDLIAFYETPTGRKSIRLAPELMRRGAMVGSQIAQEHSAELQQMLQARAEELSR